MLLVRVDWREEREEQVWCCLGPSNRVKTDWIARGLVVQHWIQVKKKSMYPHLALSIGLIYDGSTDSKHGLLPLPFRLQAGAFVVVSVKNKLDFSMGKENCCLSLRLSLIEIG